MNTSKGWLSVSLSKLTLIDISHTLAMQLLLNDITLLDITISHTLRVATLPFHHRDPFDRLLIAQSLVEGIPIIGVDSGFDAYGVNRLW